ncbi:hypothetical protein SAMN04488063_0637 [Halopelagius inordinatus]|uniref:DUF8215 domain-containing protein n=1 Tax=Halopelagius inordinatus TaxID=553467 RepID=A0A1I2MB22_9EURY|nr:hypothetical protein [Halopelagius inordinatus]SFF88110.1 hypothetical protein SAMN04488063_0637 [Halopelagius inordinatus]
MRDHPARDSRPARTSLRRSWAGHGRLITVEKDPLGRYLDDVVRMFADVSIPVLPSLLFVLVSADLRFFGVKSGAFFWWMSVTAAATFVRGGWVDPPFTDVPGWVAVTPVLVALRIVAFNGALLLAAYGSGAVASAVGVPVLAPVLAVCVGVGTALGFPRLAEVVYEAADRGPA